MSTLDETIACITPLDDVAMQAAAERQATLTKPTGALGVLEQLSIQLAGITHCARPRLRRRAIVMAAASHGVAAEGVSAYPAAVTAQMVANFLAGGAAINVLAQHADAELIVVDAGVAPALQPDPRVWNAKLAPGTRNMLHESAMPYAEANAIIEAGIALASELARRGVAVIALGEIGIGNTTAAAAIVAAALVLDPATVTGRGTAIDDERLARKIAVIREALARRQPDVRDGRSILSAVGGYEIGFLAGCCLGAAAHRLPIVLDGYITAAAALIAERLAPQVRPYLIASHCSTEPGHNIVLEHLALQPLLRLGMRLGEASGAALALPIIVAAARLLDEMATFNQAGVAGRAERPTMHE